MNNDDLPEETNSNSLDPFNWGDFTETERNYALYREYLGSKIVILNNSNIAFKKNPDGSIDFETKINFDDLRLDLKQAGFKMSDGDFKSILKSAWIQKINETGEIEPIKIKRFSN